MGFAPKRLANFGRALRSWRCILPIAVFLMCWSLLSPSLADDWAKYNSFTQPCIRDIQAKEWDKAIDSCNHIALTLAPDMVRMSAIMKDENPAPKELEFVTSFSYRALLATGGVAIASAHTGRKAYGRQAAQKAIGWTLVLSGVLHSIDPRVKTPEAKQQLSKFREYQDTLESWYPGVTAEEKEAFAERSK